MSLAIDFWNHFRREIRARCTSDAVLSSSRSWTKCATDAASAACRAFDPLVEVERETSVDWRDRDGSLRGGRLDVSARRRGSTRFTIAFETELAPVGYKGRTHGKTWREEFVKLCSVDAELRVLSSYFVAGSGSSFDGYLRRQLAELKDVFECGRPGPWLLVFGSEDSTRDAEQPWLAYELDARGTPSPITSGLALRPRLVARGIDPRSE
jgi:hypothetical protein